MTFTARVLSFFEGNEEERSRELLGELQSGATVLVVSDAGMPTISDPGFRLMRDAIQLGIDVSVIPGPSAVTMAVALSGLPTDRFTFEGFPPRASGARLATYEKLRHEERTMVFFEAPHRLGDSLGDAVTVFGALRRGAICREMTKRYEETIRGTLTQLSSWADSNEVLGEITLVIEGASTDSAAKTAEEMVSRVREFEGAGMDRKAAIASVAQEFGIAKRLVYAAVVDANKMST
ncbi:unannotated protein [freshwater metagenome]|uniref:Unannotated protein n=1 Tax=freshwater metagenome TaxID=449393 RepID=A0A6J7ISA9_9ZZZZ